MTQPLLIKSIIINKKQTDIMCPHMEYPEKDTSFT